jgi:hypothetical protein
MVKEGKDPHRRLVVNKAGAVAPWETVFVKGNPIPSMTGGMTKRISTGKSKKRGNWKV